MSTSIPRWRVQHRTPTALRSWISRVAAIVLGLMIGLLILQLTSSPSGSVLSATWSGIFGSGQTLQSVVALATPLVLTGASAALCYRVRLWNIGIEGQFYIGAWAATGVAIADPRMPAVLLLATMFAAGAIGGALWALLPALARVNLGVNEVITTLLFNFIAGLWISYFDSGPWHDAANIGQVSSIPIPAGVELPTVHVFGLAIYAGAVIAIGVAVALWAWLRLSTFGFAARIVGGSPRTGAYAGMPIRRVQLTAFLVSGAVAGVAGVIELTGTVYQLTGTLSNNFGYTGIAVAVIAGFSLLGVIAVAVILGAIASVGISLQLIGVNPDGLVAVTGLILVLASIGEAFARMRVVRLGAAGPGGPDEVPAARSSLVGGSSS
jgi:ABC-type uncharacterized transport system permease subunit